MTSAEFPRRTKFEEEFSNILMSFCPDILISHLHDTAGTADLSPSRSWFQDGACMLVDISGFTRLSGELCASGGDGLDKLRQITSGYLSTLLYLVYSNGGDVIAFAGDALVCVFQDESGEDAPKISAKRAVACGYALKDLSYDNKLQCHIAVSCGRMCCAVLEGAGEAKSFVINGECIHNLSSCIDDAGPSELVICRLTNSYVQEHVNSEIVFESTNFRVNDISGGPTADMTDVICFLKRYQNKLHNLKLRDVTSFVPKNVVDSYYSGSFHLLGELREVTTVFIKIESYVYHRCSDLMSLDGFFAMATEALKAEGGYLRQFIVDDKGCVLIALWGVPNASYDSNSQRALNFSARVLDGAKPLGHSCSAGITTGTAFYGSIGSSLRRDIVAMGAPINFSARLMSRAKGRILLDNATFDALPVDYRSRVEPVESMKLKGIEEPVTPYSLKEEFLSYEALRVEDLQTVPCYFVKRNEVVQSNLDPDITDYITKALDKVEIDYIDAADRWMKFGEECYKTCQKHEPGCACGTQGWPMPYHNVEILVVEGPKCSGKTEIANYFRTSAEKHKLRCHTVVAKEVETTVPYSTLVRVFTALLQCPETEPEKKETAIKKLLCKTFPQLQGDVSLLESYYEKLLDVVMPVMQTSHNVKYFDGVEPCRHREKLYSSDTSPEILLEVITALMERSPTALIIEDFHLVDLVSKSMLMNIRALRAPAAVLFTQRTFTVDEDVTEVDSGVKKVCTCGPVCVCGYRYKFNRYGKVITASSSVTSPEKLSTKTSTSAEQNSYVRRFKLGPLTTMQVGNIVRFVLNPELKPQLSEGDFNQLVSVIRTLSDGNPHWVFAYAKFAKGRGGRFVESFSDEFTDDGLNSWARTSSVNSSPPSIGSGDSSPNLNAKKSSHLNKHVLSVINSLTAVQSTVLKLASVLGNVFSAELLKEILPQQAQDSVIDTLAVLEDLMLIKRTITESPIYHFVTAQVRQIIYDLVPPSDMKLLHAKAADISASLKTVPANVIAYHYFMAFSGPSGESVRQRTCEYATKAALDEINSFQFADAFEYCNIAELTAGDDVDLVCHLLQCVRECVNLIEQLETKKEKSVFMFMKDAQKVVFGNISNRLRKSIRADESFNFDTSTSSLSSEGSDYGNLNEYIELRQRLEGKMADLLEKIDDFPCDYCAAEVKRRTIPTKITGCCIIS